MKRISLWFVVSIITLLIVTGCTSAPESSTSTGNNSGDRGSSSSNELIIAVLSDATQIDPHTGTDIPSANVYHGKIYEGLVKQDENMEIQPALATEWESIDDLTWEFTLREDVTFHDGTPFNAEAVKKNFERITSEEIASPRATLYDMIEEIKIIDEH